MDGPTPSAEAVERFRSDLAALAGDLPNGLGVAVSGGPDSLALLLLARAALPDRVKAATVDHGLRPEAGDEAAFVAQLCARLGVAHETLRPAAPITGNLQSAARQARYALLEDWRRARSLDRLATAHHADDQAETLLMRLNRGSGIAGLSGVRAVNMMVVRPLLGWRRSELEAIVREVGIDPISDPSNLDDRFDRVRLRRQLRQAEWIDAAAVARSASALAEAETALGWAADRLWGERAVSSDVGIRLDPEDLPAELRRRLVRRAIEHFAPGAAPRGEALGRFIAALEAGEAATLAGVKGRGGRFWDLGLAPPRRG